MWNRYVLVLRNQLFYQMLPVLLCFCKWIKIEFLEHFLKISCTFSFAECLCWKLRVCFYNSTFLHFYLLRCLINWNLIFFIHTVRSKIIGLWWFSVAKLVHLCCHNATCNVDFSITGSDYVNHLTTIRKLKKMLPWSQRLFQIFYKTTLLSS